ncbi:MAG: GAF domain-containing protein [Rhodospirillaceae bacterium]|nr:GAF domain-containing protein [Rhodospirillaceae bacterium]
MAVNTNDVTSLENLLIENLHSYRDIICPNSPDVYEEILDGAVRTALTIISRTDALYHDVEHTCLVTLCGQDIYLGRELRRGDLSHSDWLHFTIACLFHDIGYVRGLLDDDDEEDGQRIDSDGNKIQLPAQSTDAALTPYHVYRGQEFVISRNWHPDIDVTYLASLISQTEFPVPANRNIEGANDKNFRELAQLIQSADLVGQLADPNYMKKIPALYYEFYETGAATRLGYSSAYDLAAGYPTFFYNFVFSHVEHALDYLNDTDNGKKWTSHLYSNVFSQENSAILNSGGITLLSEIPDILDDYDIEKGLKIILKKVCEYQNWPVGHIYELNEAGDELLPTKIWYFKNKNQKTAAFEKITMNTTFKKGKGLPGRVWKDSKPHWIEDVTADPNFPRSKHAKDVDVACGLAFPVFTSEHIKYVFEIFSLEPEAPDKQALAIMGQVGFDISMEFK